jgi:nucleotide-binding universal stress UspA family protein
MIYPVRTILAAIADLDPPYDVLPSAIELADRTGAELHVVHAFDLPDLTWDIYARIGYPAAETLHRHAEQIRQKMEQRVRSLTLSERVHCHAVSGSPASAVRALATRVEPDLIVIGATRHSFIGRAVLGTTAQRVLRAAHVPVLVLRGPLPARLERVLLTTDLSAFSAGIHEAALDVIESVFDGEPAFRSVLAVPFGTELPPPLRSDLLQEAATREIHRFLGERRERAAPVEGVIRLGDPSSCIVTEAQAWQPDLIVVGTHGRHGPEKWVLGSVAESVLRSAASAVLVIPASVPEERTLPVPIESPDVPLPPPA